MFRLAPWRAPLRELYRFHGSQWWVLSRLFARHLAACLAPPGRGNASAAGCAITRAVDAHARHAFIPDEFYFQVGAVVPGHLSRCPMAFEPFAPLLPRSALGASAAPPTAPAGRGVTRVRADDPAQLARVVQHRPAREPAAGQLGQWQSPPSGPAGTARPTAPAPPRQTTRAVARREWLKRPRATEARLNATQRTKPPALSDARARQARECARTEVVRGACGNSPDPLLAEQLAAALARRHDLFGRKVRPRCAPRRLSTRSLPAIGAITVAANRAARAPPAGGRARGPARRAAARLLVPRAPLFPRPAAAAAAASWLLVPRRAVPLKMI
jgi:hypothetical protein